MTKLYISEDKQEIIKEFYSFFMNPDERYLVIPGKAGTGKSFLINLLAKAAATTIKMHEAMSIKTNNRDDPYGWINPSEPPKFCNKFVVTATTGAAVDNIRGMLDVDVDQVCTIHSFLGVYPKKDKIKTVKLG
ncbi:MAG TPA: hypothetical protein EYP39_02105 [Ghiorsea sp.]|nr:hypothetical protein [Ghiorsea sp.]